MAESPIFDKDAVLKHRHGGPYGLGDPEDKKIHLTERNQIVPAFQREIIIRDYCSKWNDEYTECTQNNRWTQGLVCRKKFDTLKSCLKAFYDLPELKEQAEKEYLQERYTYRMTGIKRSDREKINREKLYREQLSREKPSHSQPEETESA